MITAEEALTLTTEAGRNNFISDILDAMSRQQTWVVVSATSMDALKFLIDKNFTVSKVDYKPHNHRYRISWDANDDSWKDA